MQNEMRDRMIELRWGTNRTLTEKEAQEALKGGSGNER